MNTSHLPRHEYTYTPPPTPEERLAAAAPELLGALRAMVIANHGLPANPAEEKDPVRRHALVMATAAIARAEGGQP